MQQQDFSIPVSPPNMPKVKPSRFTRWMARSVMRWGGWKIAGEWPDVPKLVLIAAPHSSNWDGFWGMAVKIASGLDVKVLGKSQLFWWPFSLLMRKLGVVPVDRSSPHGTVEQAINLIRDSDKLWYVIAPEGTRKRVEKWKRGFWTIARGADVPILMAYFDYSTKTVGIGPLFHPTGDAEADMAAIRQWYKPYNGKNRGVD